MNPKTIYNKLNLIADKLNIKIIKGKGNFKGGCCVIKEEAVIVINKNKPFEERVRNLALGLLEFNLDEIQIDLKIKNLIDDYKYAEVKYER